ncbi:hypothetical protein ACQR1H_31255 [Bradyrhizobium sp. HKCCYLRH2015]|uniref:hypothetical protein n=1 Tax=Bradyrhizobium TaxID=374 RepID=UPI003EC087D8
MTIDDLIKITTAVTGLLKTIVWPIVVLWIVLKFAPLIRDFLADMTEGSLKAFGVEATAKRKAAIHLATAELVKYTRQSDAKDTIAFRTDDSIRSAETATQNRLLHRLVGCRALWVDDNPGETFYERSALTSLGLELVIATDTQSAIALAVKEHFDVAIILPRHILPSDGADRLFESLLGSSVPYIFYGKPVGDDAVTKAAAKWSMATVTRASNLPLAIAKNIGYMTGSDAMQSYVGYREDLKRH